MGNAVGYGLVAVAGVLMLVSGALAIVWLFRILHAACAIACFVVGWNRP